MRFLRRIEGVTLFDKVLSSEIRKSLENRVAISPNRKISLKWFGHVGRVPQERLSINGKVWWDDREQAVRMTLESQRKLWKWWQTVMCSGSSLSCCLRNPHGHEWVTKKEDKNDVITYL